MVLLSLVSSLVCRQNGFCAITIVFYWLILLNILHNDPWHVIKVGNDFWDCSPTCFQNKNPKGCLLFTVCGTFYFSSAYDEFVVCRQASVCKLSFCWHLLVRPQDQFYLNLVKIALFKHYVTCIYCVEIVFQREKKTILQTSH